MVNVFVLVRAAALNLKMISMAFNDMTNDKCIVLHKSQPLIWWETSIYKHCERLSFLWILFNLNKFSIHSNAEERLWDGVSNTTFQFNFSLCHSLVCVMSMYCTSTLKNIYVCTPMLHYAIFLLKGTRVTLRPSSGSAKADSASCLTSRTESMTSITPSSELHSMTGITI